MRKYYCTLTFLLIFVCFAFSQKESKITPYDVNQRSLAQDKNLSDGKKPKTDGKKPLLDSKTDTVELEKLNTVQELGNRIDRAEDIGGITMLGLIIWTLLVGFVVFRLLLSQKQKLMDEVVAELNNSAAFQNAVQNQVNKLLNKQGRATKTLQNKSVNKGFRDRTNSGKIETRVEVKKKSIVSTTQLNIIEEAPVVPSIEQPTAVNESVDFVLTKYFSPPSVDGVFQGAYIENTFQRGESIFTLITEDKEKGKFTLIDKQDVVRQVNKSPSLYLSDACTIEGSGSFNNQKEIKIKPGKIIKQGKNWKITQKAIIQLT